MLDSILWPSSFVPDIVLTDDVDTRLDDDPVDVARPKHRLHPLPDLFASDDFPLRIPDAELNGIWIALGYPDWPLRFMNFTGYNLCALFLSWLLDVKSVAAMVRLIMKMREIARFRCVPFEMVYSSS